MTSTKHFTFDLTGALSDQLFKAMPTLTRARLTPTALNEVDVLPGIYQLYLLEELVYIGKADKDLRGRLYDHYRKISGRLNITTADMSFTGLYLEGTWTPIGPEVMLANRFKAEGFKVPWFGKGFGMNNPGKERDTTTFKSDHFDVQYPIDLDCIVPGLPPGSHPVNEILPVIKEQLPYAFRYDNQRAKHRDYLASQMIVPAGNPTAAQVFDILAHSLPFGWRIIALPGYVIMYKNAHKYPSAVRIFKS